MRYCCMKVHTQGGPPQGPQAQNAILLHQNTRTKGPRQITVTVTLGEDKPVTDDELTIFLELSRRVEIRGLSPSSRWRETVVASPADDVTAWKRARDVLESSLPADSFVLKPTVKSRGFILHEGPRHDRALISCGIVGAPPVVFRAFADPRELLGQALSTRALARSLVAAALERQRDFDYDALVASLNAMVFDESDLGIQLVSRRIGVAVEAFEPGAFAKYRKNWTVDFILEGPQATSVGLVLRPAVFATRWRGMADKEGIFRYYGTGRVAASTAEKYPRAARGRQSIPDSSNACPCEPQSK